MILDRNISPFAAINPAKIAGGAGGLGFFYLAGVPRPSAAIQGKVYYVNDDGGSDSFDGLSPDTPYKTILKAGTVQAARIDWAASDVPWSNNDAIVIWPGVYDETNLTAGLYGVHIVGLGNGFDTDGQSGVTIKPTTGKVWDASSWINGSLSNVTFASTATAVPCVQLDTLNRFLIQDVIFAGIPGASATTTIGLEIVADMTGSRVQRFQVLQCLTGLSFGITAPKQITGNVISDFEIMAAETAGIQLDADCVAANTVFKNFIIGPTPTLGIDDNASGATYYAMFVKGWIEASGMDPATADGHYSQVYVNGTLYT